MKIFIENFKKDTTGGGSSFCQNLDKALSKLGVEITGDVEDNFDIMLIAGATLANKPTVRRVKEMGKPIILRVDNILEDRKNRNTGMSRLKNFAEMADIIVYQSEWAKRLLSPICGEGTVIKNGVDTDIFYPKEKKDWTGLRVFYSRWGRGEGKNFDIMQYKWREHNLNPANKNDVLVIVGKFSGENLLIANPFEFHNGETFDYKGIVMDKKELAEIIRSCDLAILPYDYDACSNSILEVQACGLPVMISPTGGTPEITNWLGLNFCNYSIEQVMDFKNSVDMKKLHKNFIEEFNLDLMGEQYKAIFEVALMTVHEV